MYIKSIILYEKKLFTIIDILIRVRQKPISRIRLLIKSRDTLKKNDYFVDNTVTFKFSIYKRSRFELKIENISDIFLRFTLKSSLGVLQSQSQSTLKSNSNAHYSILSSNFDKLDSNREEISSVFSTSIVIKKSKKPLFDESDDDQSGLFDKREEK